MAGKYLCGVAAQGSVSVFMLLAWLCLSLLAAHAQTNDLIQARPDFQNQLYLATPTNAPGTALAQPASVALFSGSISDATNPTNAAPNDGQIFLTQAGIGQAVFAQQLIPVPPAMILQPRGGSVLVGQRLALSAAVSGDAPLIYQWRFNGSPIPGETNFARFVLAARASDVGQYDLVVTNNAGAVTSSMVNLAVNSAPLGLLGWGNDSFGQASVPLTLGNFSAFAPGHDHALALLTNGVVIGWGRNLEGQLNIPSGLSNVVALAAGAGHSVALRSDGTVVAWGGNSTGQTNVPATAMNVVAIASGDNFTYALRRDGTLVGWGRNNEGQLNMPVGVSNVIGVVVGANTTFAQLADGTLRSWGNNYNGQAAIPANATNLILLSVGARHTVAVRGDGALLQWGGFFGNPPSGADGALAVRAALDASILLRTNRTVAVWGDSSYGQTSVPVGLDNVLDIAGHCAGYTFYALVTGAPRVLTQPQGGLLTVGTDIVLRTTAAGAGPVAYQWRFNGAALAGATNTVLSITNIQLASAGNYTVVVSNALGTANSLVATLTIPTLQIARQGSGTVSASPAQLTYAPGQQVTLTATPARYYEFVGWSDGVTASNRTITIGASNVFTAVFASAVPMEELVFPQWQSTFGGTDFDRFTCMVAASDGGFLLGGYSYSSTNGNKVSTNWGGADYWVVKIDASGTRQWERSFGGLGLDFLFGLNTTADGGYMLVGESVSDAGGNKTNALFGGADFWAVKLDASGNKQWERSYGGSGVEGAFAVQQTGDGGYIIGGYSASQSSLIDGIGNKTAPNIGQHDIWIVKTDANGNKQWDASFGGGQPDGFGSIQQIADGGYFIGGTFRDSGIAGRFWGVKIDAGGNLQWERKFAGGNANNSLDFVSSAGRLADGGYFLGGRAQSNAGGDKTEPAFGDFDYWFLRLDATGAPLWNKAVGGTGDDELNAANLTADGGFLLAGFSGSGASGNKQSPGFGGNDGWLVRLDSTGNKQWELALGGSGEDELRAISITADGYVLAGQSGSTNGNKTAPYYGGPDYWVVKLAANEAPVGTPAVLVNGLYSPSNHVFNTQTPVTITLTSTWNGPIHYTLDGSEPDFNTPTIYDPENPPQVAPPATVKAIAYLDDLYLASQLYSNFSEVVSTWLEYVPLYTLNVSTPGGGTVTATPAGSPYASNSVVTITATNLPGWTFLGWQGGVTNTNPVVSLTLRSNFTAQALFGTALTTNMTGLGSIARAPTLALYPYGSTVRLTALPGAARYLSLWGGALAGSISPQELTFTNANPTVSATFGTITGTNFGLVVQITGEGTVSYTPATNRFGSNAVVTLTAKPKAGWIFTNWSGASGSTSNEIYLVMNTNKTVTANLIPGQPPSILIQPTNQAAQAGATMALVVGATGTGPLSYQWRFNGTNAGSERVLFHEDFENYAAGTNLIGQGGWTDSPDLPGSRLIVTNGTFLPGQVMNGRVGFPLTREHHARRVRTNANEGVTRLQVRVYSSTAAPVTHNSALYLGSASNLIPLAGWAIASPGGSPQWQFGINFSATNNVSWQVSGGQDVPALLSVVADPELNQVYGVYDFGGGPVETPRYTGLHAEVLALGTPQIYIDHRDTVRGLEVGELTVSARNSRLGGTQTAQLTVTNFQALDVGGYDVVVSSPFGSVTSLVAVVSLNPVGNTPPAVALTQPTNGAIFIAPASVALAAAASDSNGAVASVSFLADGTLLGVAGVAPYQFTWTNAPLGQHTLAAVATDNGGLSATSAVVFITISNLPPVVQLTQPTNGAVFVGPTNLALAASAADTGGSVVQVRYYYDATNLIGTSVAGPSYNLTWSNAPVGTFTLTAAAMDNDGATALSEPKVITLNPPAAGQPRFRFAASAYGVVEANTNLNVTVIKTGGAGIVNFTTASGSATDGQDFGGVSGSLSFSTTQTVATISIPIYDDFLPEEIESFLISLSAPSTNVLIATPGSATITITNDDTGLSYLVHTPPGAPPATLASLTAALSPTSAGGQWRLPDAAEPFWRDGGVVADFLEPGNYDIEFLPRAGWHVEPSGFFERIVSSPPALTVVTSVYLQGEISAPGWLTVTLEPPEYAPLTRWRRQGEAAWRPGGDTIQGLPPGEYVIEFLDLITNGLETPFPRVVTVSAGFGAEVAAHYKLAASGAGTGLVEKELATVRNNSLNFGYGFNGQVRTALGYGSGTVVRDRVVLTAAHVLFNETNFAFASEVWWYFQRHKGEFEPKALQPSGLIVFSNYLAARATNAPPEVLEPLDVAALYFTDPSPKPGRNGSSGYLASDTANNEWLVFADRPKFIAGYPMTAPIQGDHRGRLFTSANDSSAAFQPRAPGVFRTFGFTGLPGMSGGGLYVFESGTARHYPAAIYLGGNSDSSIVRAIDSSVVNLLDAASRAALGDTNHYAAGLVAVSLINGTAGQRKVRVEIGPPSALALSGGWRSPTMNVTLFSTNTSPVATAATNVLIEFKPVPGFLTPPSTNAPTVPGQITRVQASYIAESPRLFFSSAGLRVSGPAGAVFVLEFKTALADTNWTALSTHTLTGGGATLPQIRPTNTVQSRFYQLRWLTNY